MLDALRLIAGWGLVWLCGAAAVALLSGATQRRNAAPGTLAWMLGCGFLVGAFAVTLWMRALSLAGVAFSIGSIGLPLAIVAIALAIPVGRRLLPGAAVAPAVTASESAADSAASASPLARLPQLRRVLWIGLCAWLGLRLVLLLLEVVWTPLYPWDAWIQWATKARVWYALGHIVPFARSEAWFAANGTAWFDASPNYPATVPLWQVWSSVVLGRWDDALMNLPWWLVAVAFAIAVYGFLRSAGLGALGALVGAWLVSSLPLANVHVALAGYADLPMAAYYALAALGVWRWSQQRTFGNAALALLFAIACPTIKTPGIVWALTLLPGIVLALMPRRGPRAVAIALAAVLFGLLVLAQTHPVVLGYRLHLDFAPAWNALLDSLFLLGNWHLLWYAAIATAILAWRDLRAPPVIALSAIVGTGLLFLAVVFAFTNARAWVTDQTTINRATLHIAPLVLVWTVLIGNTWFARMQARATPAAATVDAAAT